MTVEVKICGLKTLGALQAALEAGADYVGLVFYEKSPRNVDIETARRLADAARDGDLDEAGEFTGTGSGRSAKVVALLVDPDDEQLDEVVARVAPDVIQLHGSETPERVAGIRASYGLPVMKAIKVETAADAALALQYNDACDLVLFDAKAPRDTVGALPGGNGITFDWHALGGVKDEVRWMLSGGLDPDNVAQAIALTGARAVDVSSGVESHAGEKDAALIRRFIHAAKTAKQTG